MLWEGGLGLLCWAGCLLSAVTCLCACAAGDARDVLQVLQGFGWQGRRGSGGARASTSSRSAGACAPSRAPLALTCAPGDRCGAAPDRPRQRG